MSTEKVHNAHIKRLLPDLHRSLIDIATMMARPQRDSQLLDKAGLSLERALFPLLVLVERLGPIGVVELASRVGRDYTTVSRQVARLEKLGLVDRRSSAADKRVREAVITAQGKVATEALDIAREEMALAAFKDWNRDDFENLARLMRMLVESMDDSSGEMTDD